MEVRGIRPGVFAAIVHAVGSERYGDNLACDWEPYGHEPSVTVMRTGAPRWRARMLARSSRGLGARRSASGRRGTAACWHAFRDVFRDVFTLHPDAVISTSLARYTGATFEALYPATGEVNVGSQMYPAYMPRLCECEGEPVTRASAGYVGMMPYRDPYESPYVYQAAERLDAVLAVEAGQCAWCGRDTGSSAMVWCSQDHQESWQARYQLA